MLKQKEEIPAVKTLIKREWEKQDQRGFLPSASKRKYPFSDEELLTWTKVPKVDAAVASTSKQSTLPVEDAGLLVDPLDRKAESSLKRSWEAATGIFKPAVASTCAARSMIIWIDQLDQQIEKKSSREKLRAAIPLIRGAAAFLADASADSLRLAARSAGLVNNARRALWMKSWKGDAQSKSKICAIPCEGEPLRGGRLAKGGKQIGLQHGPLRTTSREIPKIPQSGGKNQQRGSSLPVCGLTLRPLNSAEDLHQDNARGPGLDNQYRQIQTHSAFPSGVLGVPVRLHISKVSPAADSGERRQSPVRQHHHGGVSKSARSTVVTLAALLSISELSSSARVDGISRSELLIPLIDSSSVGVKSLL
ncbi:lamina-associated polypeptide 2-like [Ranitomeya variabilis]|uniref:lamina-associated polypeptide 2-like n=1 Tax=Ranitomeya variabilis TaxID=490064 RepID=UPI00405724D6